MSSCRNRRVVFDDQTFESSRAFVEKYKDRIRRVRDGASIAERAAKSLGFKFSDLIVKCDVWGPGHGDVWFSFYRPRWILSVRHCLNKGGMFSIIVFEVKDRKPIIHKNLMAAFDDKKSALSFARKLPGKMARAIGPDWNKNE